MSGQSITDRITAAQHSMTGSSLGKAVCKATTHEVSGPKKKHLDYLIHCTNEMNVNIPQLADTLFERTANNSWVVVFKSLITTHHLMMYGNERFIQYLASRNTLFNLNNFLDKGALQGYDMSTFIRRYSRYLNEKALSYRLVAVDFTKMKRGTDGVMRTMNTEKLIKTLPIIQNQLDALLDFEANPNELTNGVINAAFMLLFKDSIRLFAAYNEGVINLLEKYFDMKKNQCKEALDIYKKFLYRMTKLSEFLKVAEQVGIDQGDIPDLTQAPSSLLEALEQHLASLEGRKTKELSAASKASTLSSAVSSLSNTGMSFSRMDEKEKQQALEEEQTRMQSLKDQRLKEIGIQTPSASPSTQSMGSANGSTVGVDPFANPAPAPAANSVPNLSSDLFDLQPAFVPTVQSTPAISTVSSAWGGVEIHPVQQAPPLAAMNVDFDAVFGSKVSSNDVKPASGWHTGDLLKPTVPTQSLAPGMPPHPGGKLLANDLDSSLANLVGNLYFGGTPAKKPDMQWNQLGEKKLTGGTNWQSKTMSTTAAWGPAPMAPAPMPVPPMNGMIYAGYTPAPMPFPMTTPQVPVYGMIPPQMGQMGGVPVMAPQPMMYNQPVLRPTNPFASIPGAQMQFM
ncbi:phosphatidylinositol-binding clathrin assembly protein-like isoform X1 [Paramormyrops kingsleyae]|uniref:phosphatidylinositol-binding clathrin assembly protein-like isoform X1 n=1 Tax=Paramormyrops kingsleyae TaxID=1676925 RepID=UPI000CD60A19|nr:phosphatidylinositol-binding clathrin assembly protein-like isoform X1 [Paramormyrops kingsleyae]XP_023692947.1 phosphatidylinositol-binding clathrin assembly protein-like isoform X1 [Paramormyrops kingsleyae]XP_023692948.1 phosphatidylinositol-binding clathrin assembly protein-like isoform X1 [Paramormyrops kingsleyae]